MGVAAYYRGSKVISQQYDREAEERRRAKCERSYDAGLMAGRAEAADTIRALTADLERAKRALRMSAATLSEERRRRVACLDGLSRIRDTYRGEVSQRAYVAILALCRATRILGGDY